MRARILSLLIFALIMMSCSIKEDRMDCPCYVHVNLDSPTVESYDSVAVFLKDCSGAVSAYAVVARDNYGDGVTLSTCDRRGAYVAVYPSALMECMKEGDVAVSLASQCSALYAFNVWCDTSGENCEVDAVMHKHFCRITMTFITDMTSNYAVMMKSAWCGLHCSGKPMEGNYSCRLSFDRAGVAVFDVPRQGDASLLLEILREGAMTRSYALGNILADNGYDWMAEDLEDMTISVDYAASVIRINSSAWPTEIVMKVEI